MLLNIQALRALAAFLVVFVHLEALAARAGLGPQAMRFGNSGVDLFFVISGMIMVVTTANGETGAGRFFRHRIVRIAPFYWAMTFAVFAVAAFAPQLVQATRADPLDLIKSLLFIPFVKANGLTQPVVFVGWSLNYEMAFYVVFALGLLTRRRALGLALCCAALAMAVTAGLGLSPKDPIGAFYTSPIMLEFALGIGIGWLLPRLSPPPGAALPAMAAGFCAFCLMLAGPSLWPELDRLVMFGLPAAVIVVAALVLERAGKIVRTPLIKALGDASYAIYLTHFFVTQAVIKAFAALKLEGPLAAGLAALLTFVLVAIVGLLAHRLIEAPLTRVTRGWLTPPRPVSSTAGPRRQAT